MVAPSSWPAPVPVGGGVPDIGGVLGAITCKLEGWYQLLGGVFRPQLGKSRFLEGD